MADAIGTTATSYELISKLAEGGMAELFLARATGAGGMERHVVLKRIAREHATDTAYVQMFLDEARLAAQLHHPNIAQVYDVGRLGASYFFTMEYVHGVTVHALIARSVEHRQQLPIGAVLAVIAGTAAGLAHAHERTGPRGKSLGIIHRDISPSNLIVSHLGHVKVVDFGVAKAAGRPETRAGEIKGKVGYLSPEQCQLKKLDHRSDLYSLGVVGWEMLTAKRLWRRESRFATIAAIASEVAPPPSIYRDDLPAEVDQLIHKLLAPEPADRFQTAAEVFDAVEMVARSTHANTSPNSLATLLRELFGERTEPWRRQRQVSETMTVVSAPIPALLDTVDDPTVADLEKRLTRSFPSLSSELETAHGDEDDPGDYEATKFLEVRGSRVPEEDEAEEDAAAPPPQPISSARTLLGAGPNVLPGRVPSTVIDVPPANLAPTRVDILPSPPAGNVVPPSGGNAVPPSGGNAVPRSGGNVLPPSRTPPRPRFPPPPHGDVRARLVWWIIGGSALGVGLTIVLLARCGSQTPAIRPPADASHVMRTIDAHPTDGFPDADAPDALDVTPDAPEGEPIE